MKIKKRFQISLLCFSLCSLIIILFQGCCKEKCQDYTNPECENYDPCDPRLKANADFELYEYNGGSINYETDTMDAYNSMYAKAKYPNDTIIWIIGSERIIQKDLIRSNLPNNAYTSITCIAIKTHKNCNTQRISRDTLTKRMFCNGVTDDTSDFKAKWPWYGTYEGVDSDNPNRKYRVYFGQITKYNWPAMTLNGIPFGIPPQNPFYSLKDERFSTMGNQWGFKRMSFGEGIGGLAFNANHAFGAKGWAVREGNKLTIYYSYNETSYKEYLKSGKFTTNNPEIFSEVKKWEGVKISNEVLTR
jgi:hypothetical protein